MRLLNACCVISLIAFGSSAVLAQDPVKVAAANYKVILENASVRVLGVSYAAGAKSAMHQHPDSIAVSLAPATVRFTMPDGKSEDSEMANESARYMPAGTHSPANIGKSAFQVILVEFKTAAPGKAALPAARPGIEMKVLAEGPRAMAYRATTAATFSEPAGTTHEFDQVVIALGSGQVALSIDGKPARTNWSRGDAEFIGRGVKHESKNTGGKPLDMILVAIK
jgi:quercetin dioxygenase-like cupin family protein